MKKLVHIGRFTKYLIKILLREKVKNVVIKKDWISFEYDGEKIKYKIATKKHEVHVGNWAKTRNKVYVDDDLKGKNRDSVAFHEAIEKYVSQHYGLDEHTEHIIAEKKEEEFHKKTGGNWRSHQMKVTKIWIREKKK